MIVHKFAKTACERARFPAATPALSRIVRDVALHAMLLFCDAATSRTQKARAPLCYAADGSRLIERCKNTLAPAQSAWRRARRIDELAHVHRGGGRGRGEAVDRRHPGDEIL